MDVLFLDNAPDIRAQFVERFVVSWEEFRKTRADWIAKVAQRNFLVDINWYQRAFWWDKMRPDNSSISFSEALAQLRSISGPVLFMAEQDEDTNYEGRHIRNFVGQADAVALAGRIEEEWFESYELAEQNMYNPCAFLPSDLYVFDASMTWYIVFTHETTDWEAELDDPMKAAASRYCIICKP